MINYETDVSIQRYKITMKQKKLRSIVIQTQRYKIIMKQKNLTLIQSYKVVMK